MSLDVHLMGEPRTVECECSECGNLHTRIERDELYWDNITHNLNTMADAAGIYTALWRPEEIGITKASDLIPILEKGLQELKDNPDKYRAFNPPNGWGNYEGLVVFVEKYLNACREHPDAEVHASR